MRARLLWAEFSARAWWVAPLCLATAVGLTGCLTAPHPAPSVPVPVPASPPSTLPPAIADIVPRVEPLSRYGNPPFYEVYGKRYYVLSSSVGYIERGVASWYGPGFHEVRTSTGETYDMYGMTAAHKTLPLPAYVRVTNLENGRSVVVRVNDRGPFVGNRIIDLSYTAASRLDMLRNGTAMVEVRALDPRAPLPHPGAPVTAVSTPLVASGAPLLAGTPPASAGIPSATAALPMFAAALPATATAAVPATSPRPTAAVTTAASAPSQVPITSAPNATTAAVPSAPTAVSAAPTVPRAAASPRSGQTDAAASATPMPTQSITPTPTSASLDPAATAATATTSVPTAAGAAVASSTIATHPPLFIQAGAFADPANAERLVAKLRGGRYGTIFVRDDIIAGRKMYRVRIGPVPNVPEFDRIVAALESVGVHDAHLALD